MRVELTYFRLTGKYYTTAEAEVEHKPLYDIWDEIRRDYPSGMIVLVEVPEHEHNHPHLIMPRALAPAARKDGSL